jgi:hypothetical protein
VGESNQVYQNDCLPIAVEWLVTRKRSVQQSGVRGRVAEKSRKARESNLVGEA